MVTARRRDPLRNYQFRVKLFDTPAAPTDFSEEVDTPAGSASSGYVAGVTRVSGLSATVSSVEHWSGGNSLHPYSHPDRCTWEPITLDQGLALDGSLAAWAEAAISYAARGTLSENNPVKRGVLLDVWDPHVYGWAPVYPMLRYLIHNAWVSRYQAMPALDSRGGEVALLSVQLTHEGWQSVAVDSSLADPPPGEEGEFEDPETENR